MEEQNIARLQVAKVKCLESIEFHTRYFFKKQYGKKYILGEHHAIICEALERVLRGECKRLIINVAPRYGKTELAVKSMISHGLALNPGAKFIHLSYGDAIALDNSESIKDLIESEDYQALFPEVKIKVDSKAKDKWYTTKKGGVLARAAAGQVTGFGAGAVDEEVKEALEESFADDWMVDEGGKLRTRGLTAIEKKMNFQGCIIIDDPIKPEDADMDTIREKVNSRFDSTIRNRVNSRNTPIIIIMQRLHPNDLCGYLQRVDEADKWEVITLPCIKEDGTALWAHRHTIQELEALRKANDVVFERQMMQNPKPKEGLMFPEDELNYFDIINNKLYNFRTGNDNKATANQILIDGTVYGGTLLPTNSILKNSIPKKILGLDLSQPEYIYIPVDPANLGGDDFAGLVTYLYGDKIFVVDVLYNTQGTDINELNIVDMVLKHKAHGVGIEGVFGWAETVQRIRERLDGVGYEGEVRQLKPRTAKHVRITSRSAFIRNHFYFRGDWIDMPQYAKFMRNLTSYKRIQEPGKMNKHDEAPDVCEMGASFFERNFGELWQFGTENN
jgi:hypothetical protein